MAELNFQPGLNILIGANNVGKTAVVDALRALLAGHDEPYPRLDIDDVHHPKLLAFTYMQLDENTSLESLFQRVQHEIGEISLPQK